MQHRFGHGALGQGFPGEDLQGHTTQRQIVKLPQPLLLPGTGYHRTVVQGQLPAGENRGSFPQKGLQLLLQPPGGNVILADEDDALGKIPPQARNQMAAVDLTDAGDGGALLLVQRLAEGVIFRNLVQGGDELLHFLIPPDFCHNAATRKGEKPPLSVKK